MSDELEIHQSSLIAHAGDIQNYMVQWKNDVEGSVADGTRIDDLAFTDVGQGLSHAYGQVVAQLGVHCQQIYRTFGSAVGALREAAVNYGRAEEANKLND
ncbi:MAG: hypothetical protein ACRDP6_23940 [Actinoallomurus sp.]